jgi:hypothetical protein
MMDNSLPIQFRNICSEDYPFIIQTWGRIFRENYPTNLIPANLYFAQQNNLINSLLTRSETLVAYLDNEPNAICGFIVAEQKASSQLIVHWCHVKSIYRRLGIMNELLEQLNYKSKNLICTHHFSLLKKIKDKYNIIYDPTILWSYNVQT